MKKNSLSLILPVMFGFLAMGFIDMIGLVTNNVRADFKMSDGRFPGQMAAALSHLCLPLAAGIGLAVAHAH